MSGNNILFIMADQFRWDGLGVTGGWVNTPNLDSLANEGMLFDNCLTNSPVCIPARVSLATGLYPHNTGIWNNVQHDLPLHTHTWMQEIRKSDYRTCLIGKSHLHLLKGDIRHKEHFINAYGFDDVDEIAGPRKSSIVKSNMTETWERHGFWKSYIEDIEDRFSHKPFVAKPSVLPIEFYADVYVGQRAKRYLQQYNDERPWFCMVSFGGPHEPWDAPEPYASMYDPEKMPKPIPKAPENNVPKGYLHKLYESGNSHSPVVTEREIAELRANYAGNITLIDEQIGSIFQAVKERNEWDKTTIVFVSDHGEMNGDHGLIYKENFLNSSVKVPLIIRTPELKNAPHVGTRYSGLVELFDLGPTLCNLADGRPNSWQSRQFGKSLTEVMTNPDMIHRDTAISEIHGEILIQNDEWKMALTSTGIPYLLFDVRADPDEQNNLVLSSEMEPIIGELKDQLLMRLISSQTIMESKPTFTPGSPVDRQ